MDQQQQDHFKDIQALFPNAKTSYANSSGIFLGEAFHGDMVRPGCALYGVNPTPDHDNPMKPVVLPRA